MGLPKKNKIAEGLKRMLARFRGAMFPEGYVCLDCGAELHEHERKYSLCERCANALPYRTGTMCAICGDYISGGTLCKRCARNRPAFDKVYSPFDYSGVIRKMIITHKDRDATYLTKYIALHLSEYLLAMKLDADFLTFVPSTAQIIKKRGFEHNEGIAKTISDAVDIPLITPLVRLSHAKDMSRLDYAARLASVAGAFALSEEYEVKECSAEEKSEATEGYPATPMSAKRHASLEGKRIMLLDDVLTTGATASACAELLKQAGASEVLVVTLARRA